MMAMFLWGRFRYDVTAMLALLAGLALGIVKPKEAFTGFSDDIVIIVGSALVISAAVQRSGMIERALGLIAGRVTKIRTQLLVLTASVGVTSALVKNVGALAMLMPAAFQMAKKNKASPSVFLMPMSFASLLGGLMTLVGTSPNIIVSRVRQDMVGQPFRMFDYFPTGFGLLVIGLIFLRFGYRLLPRDRRGVPTMGEALDIKDYVTEITIGAGSPAIDETVDQFTDRHDGDVTVTSVMRAGMRSQPQPWMTLREGDTLILGGEPDVLERVIATNKFALAGSERDVPEDRKDDEIGVIEAVIATNSPLIGRTASRMQLQRRLGINLIAVSREGERLTHRLGGTVLRAGDVIVLQGPLSLLPERLPRLGALPLAERSLRLGNPGRGLLPVAILAVAMIATATGYVPVAVAFFAAAALILAIGALPLAEAYDSVEWPILIMLGALIPVSDTLRTTGASQILATWLAHVAASLPPWGAVALILVSAMAVTRVPQQRRDGVGDGADRRGVRARSRLSAGSVPDSHRDGRGLRFPHPDRAPVQHVGVRARRLQVRRLCPAGRAVVAARRAGRHAADPDGLAAPLNGEKVPPQCRGGTIFFRRVRRQSSSIP